MVSFFSERLKLPEGENHIMPDASGLSDFVGTTNSRIVPKLCPKISQGVEKSIKISKNIAIRKGLNFERLQGKSLIFSAFCPFCVTYTR